MTLIGKIKMLEGMLKETEDTSFIIYYRESDGKWVADFSTTSSTEFTSHADFDKMIERAVEWIERRRRKNTTAKVYRMNRR